MSQQEGNLKRNSAQEWMNFNDEEFREQMAALDDRLLEDMQNVDRLFGTAPLIDAPFDFADKVMKAIELREEEKRSGGGDGGISVKKSRWQFPKFPKLPRILMMGLALPVALGLILFFGNAATATILLQQAVMLFNTSAQDLATLYTVMGNYFSGGMSTPALFTSGIVTLFVWWWLMNYVSRGRQQVVYRIPVNFQ